MSIKPFIPRDGDKFYVIRTDVLFNYGESHFHDSDVFDSDNFKIGNCFESESDVKAALEYLKVAAELRRLSAESGEFENPWDGDRTHFFLSYSFEKGGIFVDFTWDECHGDIYFSAREDAKNAAETIGTERLIKYWFGIPHVLEVKEGEPNG